MNKLRSLFFGTGSPPGHHLEKFVSSLGALLAIFCVGAGNAGARPDAGMPLVGASRGASAVLLFATPHSPFTQPWAVLGGQMVSALVGVACARYLPRPHLAAAVAVGLALLVIYYLHCLHPPGNTTTHNTKQNNTTKQKHNKQNEKAPVMLDALIIVGVAVL